MGAMKSVRIAVLGDVHGNLEALGAALAHAETLKPDLYVVIGDIVVGAADSLACWERVKALSCPVLRGNHEGYIVGYGAADAPAAWSTPQYAPVAWAAASLGPVKSELARLPFSLTLPGLPKVLFVHASARSDRDNISAYTSAETLQEMFPEVKARVIVRGHDHVAATRSWNGTEIITTGSVGLPLNGVTEAQYLLLEARAGSWQPFFQAVPYDVDAALARFYSSGYIESVGPMARLFYREVATAAHHLIPFLRGYSRWSEGDAAGFGNECSAVHGARVGLILARCWSAPTRTSTARPSSSTSTCSSGVWSSPESPGP